jgi:prevent-host-death family protein
METVTTHKAKTELSKLLARAEAGEEIIIARGSKPIAFLGPISALFKRDRQPGSWKGRMTVPPSSFEPLPEEELNLWEGGA